MSSVTDPSHNRIVFCEGEAGSPDISFWTRILINPQNRQANSFRILIKPMGGKQAAKNFARGYELATSNDNWLILRDRDLDAEIDQGSNIAKWGDKVILTGYTCIESYFLEPELMEQYLSESNLLGQQSISSHRGSLLEVLQEIRDYQAVRWALQKVRLHLLKDARERNLIRTAGQFDLPNRLTQEDGRLPPDLTIEGCMNKAIQFIQDFQTVFEPINIDDFRTEVEAFRERFDGEAFWENGFKQWFHGKDILKFWLQRYNNVGYKEYCRWAANRVDWMRFQDLLEIQRICLS